MAKRKAADLGKLDPIVSEPRSRRRVIEKPSTTASPETSKKRPAINKTEASVPENDKLPAHALPRKSVTTSQSSSPSQQFWLMKAEPESRLENGHDVKFSIDDLQAKLSPEPWDGIRAYAARNNLRAMKKGDLAFFYHSNCKVPGIVGIMEIVQEHTPDFTAQDPNATYYDPKDTDPSNPKWSVVHVEFRRKFKHPITLKELRDLAANGGELSNMQMLKQSRLSVSQVKKNEWEFLLEVATEKESKDK